MRRGFTIVELLVAIAISGLIIGILASLLLTSSRVFNTTKTITDLKENARLGAMQLEWLFQRWGTSTPCADAYKCTQVISCGNPGNFNYPPDSSLCITIQPGNPCDEVWFYANLYGLGFVDRLTSPSEVAVMSCRLYESPQVNCYHVKRGGLWMRSDSGAPLIVRIRNLSREGADCIDVSGTSNAEMDRDTDVLNGLYQGSNTFRLEGGDLLLRVPHRVHLFCQPNPRDNNRQWLYMEIKDMADACKKDNKQPLFPVEEFHVVNTENAVKVSVKYKEGNKTFTLERVYGR